MKKIIIMLLCAASFTTAMAAEPTKDTIQLVLNENVQSNYEQFLFSNEGLLSPTKKINWLVGEKGLFWETYYPQIYCTYPKLGFWEALGYIGTNGPCSYIMRV